MKSPFGKSEGKKKERKKQLTELRRQLAILKPPPIFVSERDWSAGRWLPGGQGWVGLEWGQRWDPFPRGVVSARAKEARLEPESMEVLKRKPGNSGNPINRGMEEGCYVVTVTSAARSSFLMPSRCQLILFPRAGSQVVMR